MRWMNAMARVESARARSAVIGIMIASAMVGCGGGGDVGGGGVTNPPPASVGSVSVTLSATSARVGSTVTATADVRGTTGAVLTGRTVSWASGNSAIATVSSSGVITAATVGTVSIAATVDGVSGSATLTVTPPPVQTVTVTLASASVIAGNTTTATATLADDKGAPLSGRSVTWSSGTPTVATVDTAGRITAVAAGTTTITATSEGKTGTASLTVLPVPVASVTVAVSPASVLPGGTAQATATPLDATGAVLTGRAVTWSSSAPSIASINTQGVVVGVAPGTVTVTATVEGRTGQAVVTVVPPVTSVVFTGALRQKVGDSYPISLTLRTADGSIVTRAVTWRVLDPATASVSQSGIVTPLATGGFTLIADIDGSSWSATYATYDWVALASGSTSFQSLDGDARITTKFGVSNYPLLIASCDVSGFFFLWVRTPNALTSSGIVAYAFDAGTIVSDVWDELSPNFTTLWKRGSNTTIKAFAVQIAQARRFTLAFNEFNGPAHAADFRVTGFSSRLAPLLAQCPAALRAGGAELSGESVTAIVTRLNQALPAVHSPAIPSEVQQRALQGADARSPSLLDAWPIWRVPDMQPGVRIRR